MDAYVASVLGHVWMRLAPAQSEHNTHYTHYTHCTVTALSLHSHSTLTTSVPCVSLEVSYERRQPAAFGANLCVSLGGRE